jgi:hypothetical protein
MKGFATIIVTISIFLIAVLLLGANPNQDVSYKQNFSEIKVTLSNYEMLLNQVAQGCDWTLRTNEIQNCIDSNSNIILSKFSGTYSSCGTGPFIATKDVNTQKFPIDCNIIIDSGKEGYFEVRVKKMVVVKKYS